MKKTAKLAVGVLAAGTLLVTGCSGILNSKNTSGSVNKNEASNTSKANLYFVDNNGFVVPVVSGLPKTDAGPAGEALQYLVQGGPGEQLLRGTGLSTVLPKGTKATLNIANGLATVDLSKDVLQYKTLKEEQQIVDSIIWTLTEFSTIKKVQLQVGGQIMHTLPKGTPIGSPISRDSGINVQVAPNTNPADSSHLTVYLFDTTSAGKTFLVPVTRVIPRTDANADASELVKATLRQLSAADSGLKPAISTDDVFQSAKVENNVAKVDLKNSIFSSGATSSQQEDILKSIWMSVSANLHVSKVQITVGGKAVQVFSKAIDWSKPVSNLQFINLQSDKSI